MEWASIDVASSYGWQDYCGSEEWYYGATYDGINPTLHGIDPYNTEYSLIENQEHWFDSQSAGGVKIMFQVDDDNDWIYIWLFNHTNNGVVITWNMQMSELSISEGHVKPHTVSWGQQCKGTYDALATKGLSFIKDEWCHLRVTWDADLITVHAISPSGGRQTVTAANSNTYLAGPLMVGTGYMKGDTYFAEVDTWGEVEAEWYL